MGKLPIHLKVGKCNWILDDRLIENSLMMCNHTILKKHDWRYTTDVSKVTYIKCLRRINSNYDYTTRKCVECKDNDAVHSLFCHICENKNE